MKANKFFMMAALMGVVAFASCSKDDGPVNNGNKAVQFTAGIGEQVAASGTRAAGTTWAANDDIGIFTVSNGTVTPAIDANMRYRTTAGDLNFSAYDAANTIYYPNGGAAVDFIAYYPWKIGTVLGTAIAVEIGTAQTAATQAGFDLLYSNNAKNYSSASTGAVPLTFDHKLAKLVMNVEAGNGVSSVTGLTVSVKGMNTKNTFTLGTGSLGTANTAAAITPRTITANASYDAIIMPGTYTAGTVTVDFATGGDTYTWNVGTIEFLPGNEYTYTVKLSKGGVEATGTITPWTTNNKGTVTAEN